MRFFHLGDLHIGKIVNDFNLIDDQKYILNKIVTMMKKEEGDALLIAGDVYDKAIPSEEAVKVLDEFINKLVEEKIPTFIISGNHDSDERLNFGSSLFEKNNIFITSKFDGTLAKKEWKDAYGKVNVYLLPYVKASQVKRFYPEAEIETYEDAVRTIIENAEIDVKERNVLVAHQFVSAYDKEVKLGGSENASVMHVGTIEKIGYGIFKDFDYVALGHIHSPQEIGRTEVRYSGSLLCYSQTEIGHKKSIPMIDLKEKGETEITLKEVKPLRNMRHLKGELKHIIDSYNQADREDYIFVTLYDEEPTPNVGNILRDQYPRLMKWEYDNSHSKEMSQVNLREIDRKKSFVELITEFYKKMYGCDISEEELAIMKEVAKEAGVDYEAD